MLLAGSQLLSRTRFSGWERGFSCRSTQHLGARTKRPRSGKDNAHPCVPVQRSPPLSALMMAKLIPREGGVIKHDPAAASRKRTLQPRAVEQPTRASAAGRAQPGAGVAKTRLSIAGVPRRHRPCRAHVKKHIATTQQEQTKGEPGTGRPKGLPRPAAAAPVSVRSHTGGSGAALSRLPARWLEWRQRLNTRDKALGPQPPLRSLRAGARAWPRAGAVRGGGIQAGDASEAGALSQPPPSLSPPAGEGRGRRPRRSGGGKAVPAARPPAAPAEAVPTGSRGCRCRGGRAGPRRPELSVVLRTGGASAARCGAHIPRGRSGPALCGPVTGAGSEPTPWPLWLTQRFSTTSRFVSALSAPTARSFPAGASISRGLRLREPFRLATDGFVYLFTSTSRAESKSWPGRRGRLERGWRVPTAGIQQLGSKSGGQRQQQLSGGGKGTKPERRGGEGTVANGTEPRPVPGPAPVRRPRAARPVAWLFVMPQHAEMRAHVPGFFKQATEPFRARATRPVSLRDSLCPESAPSRCKRGAGQVKVYVPSLASQMGKGRAKGSDSCSKPPPAHTHFLVGARNTFQGRSQFLAPPASPGRPCFRHPPSRQPPRPAALPSPHLLPAAVPKAPAVPCPGGHPAAPGRPCSGGTSWGTLMYFASTFLPYFHYFSVSLCRQNRAPI